MLLAFSSDGRSLHAVGDDERKLRWPKRLREHRTTTTRVPFHHTIQMIRIRQMFLRDQYYCTSASTTEHSL